MRQGLRVGRDGRYELVAKLGEGGMGSVWRATDLQLGREVAIKRIRGVTSAALQERFLRETRALTGLSHPNVVTVFDAGADGYGTYLVMELVTGKTLAERLKEGPIAPAQAVDLFCAMCRGMSHAHKRGVVHRDLKPSNVMLNEDGVARILDFGLVRMEGSGDLSLTGVGMGTLDYASPEQKEDGGAADERSDVFSLGLVFYEMLMGRRPVPLQTHKLPQPWRDVIAKATEPDVFERHTSMDELLAETEAARSAVSHEAAISQAMGKDDDLRCPKCRLVNTLEAKFCRSCGESLRVACPACKASIRAGLKLCDQCSADVALVRQLRAAAASVSGLIDGGKLAEAQASLQEIQARVASGRVGDDDQLKPAVQAAYDRIAQAAKQGQALAEQAGRQAGQDQIEDALASWQRAVAADASLVGNAETFAVKAHALQRERDEASCMGMATLERVAGQIASGSLSSAAASLASLREVLGKESKQWWADLARRVVAAEQQIYAQRQRAQEEAKAGDAPWAELEYEEALWHHRAAFALDDSYAERAGGKEAEAVEAIVIRDRARSAVVEAHSQASAAESRRDVGGMETALSVAEHQLAGAGSRFEAAQEWTEQIRESIATERLRLSTLARRKRRRIAAVSLVVILITAGLYGLAEIRAARIQNALADVEQCTAQPLVALQALASRKSFPLQAEFVHKSSLAVASAKSWRDAVSLGRDLGEERQVFEAIVRACRDQCTAAIKSIHEYGPDANEESAELQRALKDLGAPAPELTSLSEYWRKRNAEWNAMESDSATWVGRIRGLEAVRDDVLKTAAIAANSAFASAMVDWRGAILRGSGATECRAKARRVYSELLREASSTEDRFAEAEPILGVEVLRDGFPESADWLAWCQRARSWTLSRAALEAVERTLKPSIDMARAASSLGIVSDKGSGKVLGHLLHPASGIRLLPIAAGSFDMGSTGGYSDEKPVHRVYITRSFWMATTEVTQAQYRLLASKNPSSFSSGVGAEQQPVESVSWHQAVAFCEAMSTGRVELNGVNYHFRLPTEAEWEYSCRGGTATDWHTGASLSGQQANIRESELMRTTAVGSFGANAWGLFDMHGNVGEWCLDSWDGRAGYQSEPVSDPFVSTGPGRVIRGGSWGSDSYDCRAAFRLNGIPGNTYNGLGFRVVLAPVLVP